MSNRFNFLLSILILVSSLVSAQTKISGFIFETGNRGYINQAIVTLSNEKESEYYGQLTTDQTGSYEFTVSGPGTYLLSVNKKPYFDHREVITIESSQGPSVYLKHELKRNPGYVFEITIAEKDPIPDASNDALKGALVEVYNNTKREEVLVIEDLQSPEFKVDLLKGNHYTLLIRKEGFLSKRMEAFVDVEGCILCFEGIGNVTPGVSDNLTEANSMGVLLANVEMDRYFAGKVIGLNDIYYDFGKSRITKEAAQELIKVAAFLKDNPSLKVELGSHTDSRGGSSANMSLSEKRAQSAVEFLVNKGGISKSKISAKGYGETNLTNKCADGVQCSDEEHRLNRRTELKVLDVLNEGMQRRLRQMKAEEFMDEILADLDNAGQIQVKEGQTIDEAIAEKGNIKTSYIADPNNPEIERISIPASDKDQKSEEAKIQKSIPVNQTPVINKSDVEVEAPSQSILNIEKDKLENNIQEIKEEAKVEIKEPIVSNNSNPTNEVETVSRNAASVPSDKNASIKDISMDIEEEIVKVKTGSRDIDVPKAEDISEKVNLALGEGNTVAEVAAPASLPVKNPASAEDKKIENFEDAMNPPQTSDANIDTPTTNADNSSAVEEWIRPGASDFVKDETVKENIKNRYSPDYNGYKVVVIFSRFELPKEHNIFSKYDDVDVYTTADSNKLYMVGAFSTKKEAYSYMNSKLKNSYPHSYVVGFEKGIRVY